MGSFKDALRPFRPGHDTANAEEARLDFKGGAHGATFEGVQLAFTSKVDDGFYFGGAYEAASTNGDIYQSDIAGDYTQ